LIVILTISYLIESTNFTETADLITEIPSRLNHSFSHGLIYILLMILYLLGIEHTEYLIKLELEIASYEYYFYMTFMYFVSQLIDL